MFYRAAQSGEVRGSRLEDDLQTLYKISEGNKVKICSREKNESL